MSDKWIDYSAHTPICIKISSSEKVHIEHMQLKTQIEVLFPLNYDIGVARKWGDWILECREDRIYLYICNGNRPDDSIRIVFDDIQTGLQILEVNNPDKKYEFSEVRKVELSSKGALISASDTAIQGYEHKAEKRHSGGNDMQQSVIEVIAVSEHEKRMADQEQRMLELNKKLSDCQTENQKLRHLLGLRFRDIHDTLSHDNIELDEELRTTMAELNGREDENRKIQNNIDELKKKIEEIKEENTIKEKEEDKQRRNLEQAEEALRGVTEAVEMTASKAASRRDELQGLADRYELDKDTLLLLEDGTSLEKNSVSVTIDSVTLAIEAAEKRIQVIIQKLIREVTDAKSTYGDMVSYYAELERIQAGLKEEGYVSISSFTEKIQDMNAQGKDLMSAYDKLLRGITRDVEALQDKIDKRRKPGAYD